MPLKTWMRTLCSRTQPHRMYPAKGIIQNMHELQRIPRRLLARMSPLPKGKDTINPKEKPELMEKTPIKDSENFPQLQTSHPPTVPAINNRTIYANYINNSNKQKQL
ncbi:hypothetical protein CEXT_807991 [Caerostris extrusa]|uniref:Uncharacterized protein n=1 Tax=Caerostris extrusa TaxID=172846 RepID=A0AAV4MZW5_CAEEX|nr:hypothetical protein CEXT_807991 [Caerostris extrusa]